MSSASTTFDLSYFVSPVGEDEVETTPIAKFYLSSKKFREYSKRNSYITYGACPYREDLSINSIDDLLFFFKTDECWQFDNPLTEEITDFVARYPELLSRILSLEKEEVTMSNAFVSFFNYIVHLVDNPQDLETYYNIYLKFGLKMEENILSILIENPEQAKLLMERNNDENYPLVREYFTFFELLKGFHLYNLVHNEYTLVVNNLEKYARREISSQVRNYQYVCTIRYELFTDVINQFSEHQKLLPVTHRKFDCKFFDNGYESLIFCNPFNENHDTQNLFGWFLSSFKLASDESVWTDFETGGKYDFECIFENFDYVNIVENFHNFFYFKGRHGRYRAERLGVKIHKEDEIYLHYISFAFSFFINRPGILELLNKTYNWDNIPSMSPDYSRGEYSAIPEEQRNYYISFMKNDINRILNKMRIIG